MSKYYVWEAAMDDWETWPGNELYATIDLAKFCAEQDYLENFPDKRDCTLTWEPIMKGLLHMYEDGIPNGISLYARAVHNAVK